MSLQGRRQASLVRMAPSWFDDPDVVVAPLNNGSLAATTLESFEVNDVVMGPVEPAGGTCHWTDSLPKAPGGGKHMQDGTS